MLSSNATYYDRQINENLEAPASNPVTGKLALTGGTDELPDVAAVWVRFKASPDNAAVAYVHGSGSADGWPLAAGEETGLVPAGNLQRYQLVGAAADVVHYEVITPAA